MNESSRDITEPNTILLATAGSQLYGTSTNDGTGDVDQMGVCLEPPECVIGNAQFEQWQFRTQPAGVRSGPGDLDKTIYSLRKFARLAAQGNPTVLLMLFTPDEMIIQKNAFGQSLIDHADMFISREAASRFAGYLVSQRDQMLGLKSKKHTNRPELIEKYGFDSKFAMHMVRLGIQGVELLTDGWITLPMKEPDRTWLVELRRGEHTKEEALDRAELLLSQLNHLSLHADVPESPDRVKIDRWLTEMYTSWWTEQGLIR